MTTVLHATQNEKGLVAWRKRVGEVEAERVSQAAMARGSSLHTSIEAALKDNSNVSGNEYFQSWLNWRRRQNIDSMLIESPVWHVEGYAGTIDYVGMTRAGIVIYDWKTADKPRQERYVGDYKLQVSAYAMAFSERYGIPVSHCIVLVCLPDGNTQEFQVNPFVYFDAFLQRLRAYYWD